MIKLVLDPGHGGKDPGAVGNGLVEKNLNLELSMRVAGKLADYDAAVTLTRSFDTDLSLDERCYIANNLGADLFCSLHTNSGGGTGFESFIHTSAGTKTESIRNVIHDMMADYYNSVGFRDRGKKRADFAVLRNTVMPAVLLENFFIDNPKDAVILRDVFDRLAGVIAGGLVKALGVPLKPLQPHGEQGSSIQTPFTFQSMTPGQDLFSEIARLKAEGWLNGEHQPDDPVTWGELAAVINRLRDR